MNRKAQSQLQVALLEGVFLSGIPYVSETTGPVLFPVYLVFMFLPAYQKDLRRLYVIHLAIMALIFLIFISLLN